MSTLLRGNRELIKAMNRNLIFNTIRRHGPLSRTQLTEITGLSVGAVSQIIGDLIDERWILEVGEGDYTGGRRQMLLRLNADAGCAIGLKLMENRVVCAVTNLECGVLHYSEQQADFGTAPDSVVHILAAIVEKITATLSGKQLFGVGVGLAGVIYAQSGIVHYSPYFGWRDVPLAELLRARLRLPVYVENDVNTLTITEQLFGDGRHQRNFIVVTIGRGVGMGMVINSQLYQGGRGGVGELGHITLDPAGPPCTCGKNGCLEALAADPAVIRYITQRSGEVRLTTLAQVVTAAESGDALAQEALLFSGQYLGVGIATAINLLAPSLVIISGEGIMAGDYRLQPMFEAMRRHTFNSLLDGVEVKVTPTDDQAWARGAASLVIGKLFESPLIEDRAEV
jgi:N-acetylglucosamine repressor